MPDDADEEIASGGLAAVAEPFVLSSNNFDTDGEDVPADSSFKNLDWEEVRLHASNVGDLMPIGLGYTRESHETIF